MTAPTTCPLQTRSEFPWMDAFTVSDPAGRTLTWTRTNLATGVWSGDTELSRCAAALSAAHEQANTFNAACWAAQVLLPVPGELVLVNRLAGRPHKRGVIYDCGHEHNTWHSGIAGFLTPPTPRPATVTVPKPRRCCGAYKKCPKGLS
ncbi:hypothetical protein [Mycolicibacterium fallax]|uniref:hypothetical protein n=1 Tax=Mycolicibacterium fallax TaxID=1793 RepID=UPI001054E7F0|nr:hypothetical protein [Mycolicibacterium fallax]BBY98348.1 hypothetical protein MFAL_18150 [Mycolicibacterium fallax]